jgi:hypothetical protein
MSSEDDLKRINDLQSMIQQRLQSPEVQELLGGFKQGVQSLAKETEQSAHQYAIMAVLIRAKLTTVNEMEALTQEFRPLVMQAVEYQVQLDKAPAHQKLSVQAKIHQVGRKITEKLGGDLKSYDAEVAQKMAEQAKKVHDERT